MGAATAAGPRPAPRRRPLIRRGGPDPHRLDPVGRVGLPRRHSMLRLAAVAALLLTAAGALHAGMRSSPDAATPLADHPMPPAGPAAARPAGPDSGQPAGPDSGQPVGTGPAWPPPGDRLPIPPGAVGVPVRLGDPAGLSLLRPGDRVDLFAVSADGDLAALATGVIVLAIDGPATALLLALSADQGRAVVTAAATATFAITIRG